MLRTSCQCDVLFTETRIDYNLLPDETKKMVKEFIPNTHELEKPFWLNIATSIIAQEMTRSFAPQWFFGYPKALPILAASDLASYFHGTYLLISH